MSWGYCIHQDAIARRNIGRVPAQRSVCIWKTRPLARIFFVGGGNEGKRAKLLGGVGMIPTEIFKCTTMIFISKQENYWVRTQALQLLNLCTQSSETRITKSMAAMLMYQTRVYDHNSRFPLLRQLNTTTRILYGFFIFMQTLHSQSEWEDNCSD